MTATTTPTSPNSTYLGQDPGLSRLLDNVQVEVPAITQSVIQMMAWNAIEQFYMESGWRRDLVYWTLAEGNSRLDFNPFSAQWLVEDILDFQGLHRFMAVPPGVVNDLDPPTYIRKGSALVSLKPVSFAVVTTAGVAPELWSRWLEAIRFGTLANIYAMPSKPYSNPNLAATYIREFKSRIARARSIADNNFNGAQGGRWSFPRFANGRRKN
jgi:hypothetical protein